MTTDTFTDAGGRHYIAGAEVPNAVWERFRRLHDIVRAARYVLEEQYTNVWEMPLWNLTFAEQRLRALLMSEKEPSP